MQVLRPRAERITYVPEYLIAVVGGALIIRPLLEWMQYGQEVIWYGEGMWYGAFAGALAVVISLTTTVRLTLWRSWAQAAVGYGLCFIVLLASSYTPDLTTLAAGMVLVTLAGFEIHAIDSARDHEQHSGERPAIQPAPHLRLVESSTQRRSMENGSPATVGRKPAA